MEQFRALNICTVESEVSTIRLILIRDIYNGSKMVAKVIPSPKR